MLYFFHVKSIPNILFPFQTRYLGIGHASDGAQPLQCQDGALLQVPASQGGGELIPYMVKS